MITLTEEELERIKIEAQFELVKSLWEIMKIEVPPEWDWDQRLKWILARPNA